MRNEGDQSRAGRGHFFRDNTRCSTSMQLEVRDIDEAMIVGRL